MQNRAKAAAGDGKTAGGRFELDGGVGADAGGEVARLGEEVRGDGPAGGFVVLFGRKTGVRDLPDRFGQKVGGFFHAGKIPAGGGCPCGGLDPRIWT